MHNRRFKDCLSNRLFLQYPKYDMDECVLGVCLLLIRTVCTPDYCTCCMWMDFSHIAWPYLESMCMV